MEVVWTETSLKTYYNVVDYLLESWPNYVLETFQIKVDSLLVNIKNHNNICPESKILGLRKCLIDDYNSLIYEISNEKIFLLTFIDNRSQHKF
jgi:hypothetical protein